MIQRGPYGTVNRFPGAGEAKRAAPFCELPCGPDRTTDAAPTPVLASVRTYGDLQRLLREYADKRNVTRLEIDRISGLPSGYASKVLSPSGSRRLGVESLGLIMGALGLRLAVVEDPEALARHAATAQRRDLPQVRRRAKPGT